MANELTSRAQPISAARSMQSDVAMARECAGIPDAEELRKRAAWYREIAERAGNPTIWAMRLRTAEKLEAEANRVELHLLPSPGHNFSHQDKKEAARWPPIVRQPEPSSKV
jgi:hypothetical protein